MIHIVLLLLASLLLYGCASKDTAQNKMTITKGNAPHNSLRSCQFMHASVLPISLNTSHNFHFIHNNRMLIFYDVSQIFYSSILDIIANKQIENISHNILHLSSISKILYADTQHLMCHHDNKLCIFNLKDSSSMSLLTNDAILKCVKVQDVIFILVDSKKDCFSKKFYLYDTISNKIIEQEIESDFIDFAFVGHKVLFITPEHTYISFDIKNYLQSRDKNEWQRIEYINVDKNTEENQNIKVFTSSFGHDDAFIITYENNIELLSNSQIRQITIPHISTGGYVKTFILDKQIYSIMNNVIFNVLTEDIVRIPNTVIDICNTDQNAAIICKKHIYITNNNLLHSKHYGQRIENKSYQYTYNDNYIIFYNKDHVSVYDFNTGQHIFTSDKSIANIKHVNLSNQYMIVMTDTNLYCYYIK